MSKTVDAEAAAEYKWLIKRRLSGLKKNEQWLCNEVHKKTGRTFDHSYLSKIFRGVSHNPKMINAINEILDINPDRGQE